MIIYDCLQIVKTGRPSNIKVNGVIKAGLDFLWPKKKVHIFVIPYFCGKTLSGV